MFGEVITGVNFGPGGDAALVLARRLTAGDGRLTLAHVVASDPTVWRGQRDTEKEMERFRSLQLLDRECRLLHLDAHGEPLPRLGTCAVCAASAHRGLHAVAQQHHADLIVVGASRSGRVARTLLGDDTRGALRGAPCAVAVAPTGYAARGPLRRIAVVDDGSAASQVALKLARMLAEAAGGAAAGLTVIPADRAPAAGARADLLVVASRPAARWRSTPAERLARRVTCPLLVIAGSAPGADTAPSAIPQDASRSRAEA